MAVNTVRVVVREKKVNQSISQKLDELFQADLSLISSDYAQGVKERQEAWPNSNDEDLYFDAYVETIVEFLAPDRISTLMCEWIEALPKNPDSAFLRGVLYTINHFRDYYKSISEIQNKSKATG